LQSIRRSLKPQSLSLTLIQSQRYLVQLCLRIDRQVSSFREVLSQQPGRVFVRAALPRAPRITEVHFHIRGHRESFVFGHLQPTVPGRRAPQCRREFPNVPAQGDDDRHRVFAGHFDQRSKTRMTFHRDGDVTVLGAADEIAFQMTGNGAVLDFHGPFPDADGIDDLTTAVSANTGLRWERKPKPLNHSAQQPSPWRVSSEQISLDQEGCEARKTPAEGVVFFLDFSRFRNYRDVADLQSSSSLVTREFSKKFPAHRRANLVRGELLSRGTISREIALAGSLYSTSEKPVQWLPSNGIPHNLFFIW
jgi:hypothetical protein